MFTENKADETFLCDLAGTAQQVFEWGGGAKLDEIFFGGGMLRNFYLISLK